MGIVHKLCDICLRGSERTQVYVLVYANYQNYEISPRQLNNSCYDTHSFTSLSVFISLCSINLHFYIVEFYEMRINLSQLYMCAHLCSWAAFSSFESHFYDKWRICKYYVSYELFSMIMSIWNCCNKKFVMKKIKWNIVKNIIQQIKIF